MRRGLVAALGAAALTLIACGSASSPLEIGGGSDGSTAATSAAGSEPTTATLVDGPEEFSFIVDGPLVTNGPPWNCVTAGHECDVPEGYFSGTVELIDDCIVVQGADSPPGSLSVVIFRFGVTWDESTSTILGLGPEPVAVGDETGLLATYEALPDVWADELGIPRVPDKVRECMLKAGTDRVVLNAPWTKIGDRPISTTTDVTTAPVGP